MVMNTLLRAAGDAAYRLGLGPRPSDVPDHALVELVEGPARLAPGRALDLGCGTGRNALYLARAGWETVGVDMVATPSRWRAERPPRSRSRSSSSRATSRD